jgi:diguanylate cyclase (GGDEF)-like protein
VNQQVYSGTAPNSLPRIDLRQTLHHLCRELMSSGGFQLVEIYQWDEANDQAITLADASCAAYIDREGERFELADFPTTARVLATGEIAVIDADMADAETTWMIEYGLNSLLLAPLFEQDKIIGLVEIASADRTLLSNRDTIRACQNVIEQASAWLTAPLRNNPKDDLLDLARDLKTVTNASSCSLSSWLPNSNEATVVVTYSSTFWNLGTGPKIALKEWMSAKLVLEKNLPTILHASDPDILPEEKNDLEEFKSLTKVIVPLTIGTRPIGFIDVSDVELERSIGEKELFSWGGIAGQAALAIQNAQLMDMAQVVLDEQTALRRSIEVISASVDRDVILNGLAEQLGQAVDATCVYINEFQNDFQFYTAEACFISAKGPDRESKSILGKLYRLNSDAEFRINLQRDQVAQLHIGDSDIATDDLQHMQQHGSKTRLYIPIYIRERLFGFVELWESRSIREFTDSEINLCKSMCLQAAVAIENSELFNLAQNEIKLRRQFEEKLRHEALHDPLTRLPNRRLFIDRLEQAILRRSRQHNYDFSVLYFDLDKFKWINDSFGHLDGDSVLIQVADCLRDSIRKSDTAARFGGDEFLILIEGDNDTHLIERVCQQIQSNLRSLIKISDRCIPLSASIGVAMSTQETMSADDYINRADIAMYEAKSSGGSHVKKFAPDEITLPVHNLDLRAEIRDAVASRSFNVYFQPIVDLEILEVVGLEALARWQRPNGEFVPPTKFIPILEDLRLITELGFWITQESIKQFREWQKRYTRFEQMTLSLNLSISQITDPEFTSQLRQFSESLDFPSDRINFEITENLFIHNISLVSSVLLELQGMGFGVHLDDFGTGYSSLSYLTELPFDVIKIDRSFVSKLGSQNEPLELLDSIISIGKNLKKDVIAEGIETQQQLKALKDLNCRYGQGFLFSPALAPADLESLLLEWQYGKISRK